MVSFTFLIPGLKSLVFGYFHMQALMWESRQLLQVPHYVLGFGPIWHFTGEAFVDKMLLTSGGKWVVEGPLGGRLQPPWIAPMICWVVRSDETCDWPKSLFMTAPRDQISVAFVTFSSGLNIYLVTSTDMCLDGASQYNTFLYTNAICPYRISWHKLPEALPRTQKIIVQVKHRHVSLTKMLPDFISKWITLFWCK